MNSTMDIDKLKAHMDEQAQKEKFYEDQARAHYEPIVAELRARVAELERKLQRHNHGALMDYQAATTALGALGLGAAPTTREAIDMMVAALHARHVEPTDTWRTFVEANGIVHPVTDEHVERFAAALLASYEQRIAELEGPRKSRPTALVHKQLHEQVVAEFKARIADLEANLSEVEPVVARINEGLNALVQWEISDIDADSYLGPPHEDDDEDIRRAHLFEFYEKSAHGHYAEQFAAMQQRIAELESRAPKVICSPIADTGDFDEVCSVCGVATEEPHSASQCFAVAEETQQMVQGMESDIITELKTDALRIAEALGIVHEADGHIVYPGSTDAQVREVKRLHECIAEMDAANASLSAENEELKAQLARGVFVRELSDEELWDVFRSGRDAAARFMQHSSVENMAGVRACIAAATRLPDGATRVTQRISGAGCIGFEGSDGSESVALALPDGPAVVHIVVVPEAKP